MSYFQAKSDLNFMKDFKQNVLELWKIEDRVARDIDYNDFDSYSEYEVVLQALASQITGYQDIRSRVATGILRAERIAIRLGVPIEAVSCPAPIVGGPVISQSFFYAILRDFTHGAQIERQMIKDAVNQTVGECETRLSVEKRRLINPLYWIKELVVAIIRIPFMIIEASGFDVSKVEDHFLGRIFKLFEIGIILYVLIKLGFEKESIQQILIKLF